ncbi:MAG: type IV secretory system conjugative DNA transfer family protein [Clostridium sp.]
MSEKLNDIMSKISNVNLKTLKYIGLGTGLVYLEVPMITLFKNGFSSTNLASLYLSPIKLLASIFDFGMIMSLIKINAMLAIIIAISIAVAKIKNGEANSESANVLLKKIAAWINKRDEKKIEFSSDMGTYGTAEWLSENGLRKISDYVQLGTGQGIIYGKMKDTSKLVSLHKESFFNRNVAVFGASGSGKSRTFVIPNILNLIEQEESMFITDPKGELLRKASKILEDNGYIVRALNLNNIECSDRWNMLDEVKDDLTAITFAQAIIDGTSGDGATDEFWSKGQMNLLKALALFIVKEMPEDERNMTSLYKLITQKKAGATLERLFKQLGEEHIAMQPFNIFLESADNEKVRAGMISGLATRLQLFQAKKFKLLAEGNDIDLELPGKKKCAYFIVIPDSHSSFDFMPSLFFSFAFIKLMALADRKASGRLDVQCNFLLDEFPNISAIPDFTKKISVIRSRGINTCVIFQNIAQLQNRYPDGQWEEILGNCDTHLFLGCNENTTANFISETLGVATIEDKSESREKYEINPFTGKEMDKLGQRNLLNPDEVRKLNNKDAILMMKGFNPVYLNKADYSTHKLANQMEEVPIYCMMKEWSEEFHVEWLKNFEDDPAVETKLKEILESKAKAEQVEDVEGIIQDNSRKASVVNSSNTDCKPAASEIERIVEDEKEQIVEEFIKQIDIRKLKNANNIDDINKVEKQNEEPNEDVRVINLKGKKKESSIKSKENKEKDKLEKVDKAEKANKAKPVKKSDGKAKKAVCQGQTSLLKFVIDLDEKSNEDIKDDEFF